MSRDDLFKFRIGDVVKVIVSAQQEHSPFRWKDGHRDVRGMVLERCYTEYAHGHLVWYWVRLVDRDGGIAVEPTKLFEVELVKSEPFPAKAEGG